MFATMPLPIFTFGGSDNPHSPYRPAVPSPLSSSPMRASSPPLSQQELDSLPQREIQSSPIQARPAAKFRFATSAPRANPVVRKREDARESRRNLFLKEVRQRADDKKWERRGGDQELLKLEWWRFNREMQQAKEEELAQFGTDEDIEEAARIQQEATNHGTDGEDDKMMADAIALEEEAELEALISLMPTKSNESTSSRNQTTDTQRDSMDFSDDDDYDALFMDFVGQEQSSQQGSQEMAYSQDVDMS